MTGTVVAVIVNYNSGGLLERSIRSLSASAVKPDIHVVDNASTDDSIDRARHAADGGNVTFHMNEKNLGFAAANNRVLDTVEGEFYMLVNPDCSVERDTIGVLVTAMNADPDIGIAGGMLLNPDGTVQETSKRRFPTPWNSLARTLGLHRFSSPGGLLANFDQAGSGDTTSAVETVEAISGALMFVRASALHNVGNLDEGYFLHCEDLDWCKRFHDAGYKVAYVPGARATHVKGGSGRGPRVVWHLHRGMIRFYRKHYRRDHSLPFSILVYAAVYARCALLMGLSLFSGSGTKS
jgi:GT2 family glycosyltransferase